MRRAAYLLAALVACTAVCGADEGARHSGLSLSGVVHTLDKVALAVREHYEEALDTYADKHPRSLLARHHVDSSTGGDGDSSTSQRRLLSVQGVQDFLANMLGGGWKDAVPSSWSASSFDWSNLGEFDYSSTLGEFMDGYDVQNLTDIRSVKDLTQSMHTIEAAFCTEEAFEPSEKVPAACVGPTVSIAVKPKACVLESNTKQVVCEPAKLVLIKTPGSCTHKYKSASTWTGKECKLSGSAGFVDSVVIGGEAKSIPLTQLDISYTPDAPVDEEITPTVCTGANVNAGLPLAPATTTVTLPATAGSPGCSAASLSLTNPTTAATCTQPAEFVGDSDGIFFVASPSCDTSAGVPYRADLAAAGADVTIAAIQIGSFNTDAAECKVRFTRPDASYVELVIGGDGLFLLPNGGFVLPAAASGYTVSVSETSAPSNAFNYQIIQIKRFILA